jgi:putative SOS response-associated peptidase YedK
MGTFAIITTESNEFLVEKTGYDRMAVIIKMANYQRWFEPGLDERWPIDLLRPFDSEKMKARSVDARINNEPSFAETIEGRRAGRAIRDI